MKLASVGLMIMLFCSCTQQNKNGQNPISYFNIKAYFEKEATRLSKLNLPVLKSVSINGENEQKQVKINDYKKELNTFISADINKASWRGEFVVKKQANEILYIANNEKIPVKKVRIQLANKKVKSIQIVINTTNILYHSADTLTYFPDSIYEIKKTQKIKLLREKKYVVIGRFK